MLIVVKRRFKKQHVIGGAGIFETLKSLFQRLVNSNAAGSVASKIASAAKTELSRKAIDAGKSVVKEVGFSAIEAGKSAAIQAGKKLFVPKTKQNMVNGRPVLTQQSKDTLSSIFQKTDQPTTNLNGLLAGQGLNSNAVRIEQLIRKLNGGGMKLV
jgi:replicative DNA helicase